MKGPSPSKTVAINNSLAKQRYSFSKDARFKDPRPPINIHAYDSAEAKMSNRLNTMKRSATQQVIGFGSQKKNDRFNHRFIDPKENTPAPNIYAVARNQEEIGTDYKSNQINKSRSTDAIKNPYSGLPKYKAGCQFTLGTGRGSMQPMFIDAIKKTSGYSPGFKYEVPETWGKDGMKIRIHAKDTYQDTLLKKKGQLPGPLSYINEGASIQQYKSSLSNKKSPIQSAFSKSERFVEAKHQSPSATKYDNNVSAIGKNSIFKNNGTAVIGKQKLDIIDEKFNLKEKR